MEAIINNLVKAIGWSILHSLWQGAIIYALLFVALMAWPRMNARLKHNLAFGSLFLIFASFCFTFFSVFELPSTTSVGIRAIEINQTAYQNLLKLGGSLNFKTEAYFPVVVCVYAVGIIFQLIILSSGYFKLKKLKAASTLAIPAAWSAIFESTVAQLKINKTVKFYLSAKVNVPLVVGFFKPVVLFPVALATQLDIQQVEAILIHELSHIRRNDYLINLVKTCIETMLFFNPFVWLTTKFIQIEREHACDDLVVNFTGTPLTYAHALLKLELLKDKETPALSLAATGQNQHLYQRIKRITNMKTNYINAKQQFFILTLAIATVASLAWINPTKKAEAKAKTLPTVSLAKPSLAEIKAIHSQLALKADTDSTKKQKNFRAVIKGKDGREVIYYSLDEMPDSLKQKFAEMEQKFNSKEWKDQMAKVQKNAEEIAKKFESKEWKDHMAAIQKNSEELSKKFNSPEWKDQMARVQKNAEEMTKKFESQEWKDQMAKVQKNAEEMSKKFESQEWKDQMARVQKNAEEISKKFESKEWKDQMAKVQEQSLAMSKKFESQEWKDQMAKVQKNAEEITKKFDSPEWKAQMDKIQKNAEEMSKKFNSPEWKKQMDDVQKNADEITKKFNSPEWKKKIEDYKKLEATPEYQELRDKFEKDLNELKKKKGIDSSKS